MKSFSHGASCLFILLAVASATDAARGDVVVFGSGGNAFSIDFVTIGNPGNAADTTGNPNPAGSVAYSYQIGKYEISEDMITKFNASQTLQITKDTRGTDKPATKVSWNEAARFVNWMNTSNGFQAAYNFTTNGVNDNIALWNPSDAWQLDGENRFRHKDAHFWLPSMDEWYKAAYFNPTSNSYFNFTNGSDSAPVAVGSGTANGTAVYAQPQANGPADVSLAGGLSPQGIMGMGGNVWEWEETSVDLSNNSPSAFRGYRGGSWYDVTTSFLSVNSRGSDGPPGTDSNFDIGFRVAGLSSAAVPEPASIALLVAGTVLLLARRFRRP